MAGADLLPRHSIPSVKTLPAPSRSTTVLRPSALSQDSAHLAPHLMETPHPRISTPSFLLPETETPEEPPDESPSAGPWSPPGDQLSTVRASPHRSSLHRPSLPSFPGPVFGWGEQESRRNRALQGANGPPPPSSVPTSQAESGKYDPYTR